jgi:hypothetical protein
MSLTEVLPAVRCLRRSEKLELIKFLADELAREESVSAEHSIRDGATYEVWSPTDAFEAAAALSEMLAEDRTGTANGGARGGTNG